MTTSLMIPKTLNDYVTARGKALGLFEHAVKALGDAEQVLKGCGLYGMPYDAKPRASLTEVTREVDRRLWRRAFDLTGLLQYMDAEARNSFEKDLEKAPPAFELENIRTTLLDVYQKGDEMFVRGLVNVFRRLSKNYRSNDPFKVAPKVVMEYMVGLRFSGGLELRGYSGAASERINDIDRVFKVLDGKQHQPRALETAMNAAFKDGDVFEDDYFKARAFKNGNLHLWFKRADLLEKANKLIAGYYNGSAVPDARREAA